MRRANAKTKIRPYKAPATAIADPEKIWAKLRGLLIKLQEGEFDQVPYVSTYDLAHALVLGRNGAMLYANVRALIDSKLERTCVEVLLPAVPRQGENQAQAGERLCIAMSKVWEEHIRCLDHFSCICRYMESSWIFDARVPDIVDLGHELFRDTVLLNVKTKLGDTLIATMLELIRLERIGQMINRSAFKSCIEMLLQISAMPWSPASSSNQSLTNSYGMNSRHSTTRTSSDDSLYFHIFVPLLDSATSSFYEHEAAALLQDLNVPDYLKQVEKRLSEESMRSMNYFGAASTSQLVHIAENELISGQLDQILKSKTGLSLMIKSSLTEDLFRLRKLCMRTSNGHAELRKGLKTQVVTLGEGLYNKISETSGVPGSVTSNALDSALQWVAGVLELQAKTLAVIKEGFSCDLELQKGISEAFETIMNLNPRSQEYVSLYIDDMLRKNLKGKSDVEVEDVLNEAIILFRYLSDKDKFERYYKNHLARRLITSRSTSDDAERALLAKMKVDCGYQFTQKMEGMFVDMKISSELTKSFKGKLIEGKNIDLSVNVLTATYWPISVKAPSCIFPPDIKATCEVFEKFYLAKHSGRKLTWHPDYGSVDMRAVFGKGKRKHELNVSTYCAVVFLLFNGADILSYNDILSATAIPEVELRRTLQSLACAKYKILTKSPKSRDVGLNDTFTYNDNFSAPLIKIKVSLIAAKVENEQERNETDDRVDEQRILLTEASIVRIMKGRKTILHNDLISEVIKQLGMRFQPSPSLIKKRIEALIEPATAISLLPPIQRQKQSRHQISGNPLDMDPVTDQGSGSGAGMESRPEENFSNGEQEEGNDVVLKVAIVGDPQVGKTSMMVKYVQGSFDEDYLQTLGVNFLEKRITIRDTQIVFSIWDLGGAREFVSMLPLVSNDAVAILFMFDLSRRNTLLSVKEWYRQVRGFNKTAIPFLIGTKFDMFSALPPQEQEDITKQARRFAKAMRAPLIFCSTAFSINIQSIFKIVLAKAFELKCTIPEVKAVGEPILLYVDTDNDPATTTSTPNTS